MRTERQRDSAADVAHDGIGATATRRSLLVLGLAASALGAAGISASGAPMATAASRRIGAALIAEKGVDESRALLGRNRARLAALADLALDRAAALDFRAHRTITVHGILLAEIEAAWCLVGVLGAAR